MATKKASSDAKKEQLNRFQQLFDYIVDYEQARGMISSLEASDVSRCGSHEERLKWLLRKLKEETENAEELLEVLRAESSFAWFVDCLDQIDLSQVDQEDGQQLLARTLGRLSFGADAAKRNKEESEASWSHVSEATKELNEQLKLKFRKLHTEIVNMNMSPIIDQLFQENVLSSADNKSLVKKARDPSSQAKLLLSKLHSSRNPEAFVKLRQAMQRQKAFSTIIKRLDGVNFDNDAAATERSVSSVSTGKTQTATVVERLPVAEVIVGVTSLDDELYVLRAKSDHEIEVYDCSSGSRTFKFLRHLNISGTRGLVDIASCSHQKRVYVADCVKCVIHAFLSKQQDATTKWPIGLKPASLSTTPRSSSVLVTCADVCKLREFTADGNLLREINLRPDVDGLRPTHAVATSDEKNLAAIFGDDVCLVEKSSGGILRSYGGTLGDLDADHELDSPLHLAVDKDGCVLVADCFNGRVLSLSGKLDYVGEVATREQLDWFPVKVCLDADNRRLYVAVNEFDDDTYKAGRVVVLDL